MNWNIQHQLKYLLIVLACIALVIFIMWKSFFTTDPTCFDKKQNADEQGIDCGGACELLCRDQVRDVVIEWARALPVTDTVYNLVASVENQNVRAGIQRIAYEFRTYDDRNILIDERIGETFIGPNQKTTIFEPGITVGNTIPYLTTFKFLQAPVWHSTEERFSKKLLTVENETWNQLDSAPQLRARIRNNNMFDIAKSPVVVVVYDDRGNAIATSQTILESIPQGSFRDITFTWPRPLLREPVQVVITPRVNPFI